MGAILLALLVGALVGAVLGFLAGRVERSHDHARTYLRIRNGARLAQRALNDMRDAMEIDAKNVRRHRADVCLADGTTALKLLMDAAEGQEGPA